MILYFLWEQGCHCFKIGISRNVPERIYHLPQNIDFDRSRYIACNDEFAARQLERKLHARFADLRIVQDSGEGSTEWFHGDCFPAIEQFLNKLKYPPPIPLSKAAGVFRPRIPKTLAANLQEIAWTQRISFTALVMNVLEHYLADIKDISDTSITGTNRNDVSEG